MNIKPGWAWALLTFTLAGTAHAQTPPPGWYPLEYPAHISIRAAPSKQLEVVRSGEAPGSPTAVRCTEYCDFWALPGKYTLYALDHRTGERKSLALRIKHSSRFTLETGDPSTSSAGLVLGIVGSASLAAGVLVLLTTVMSSQSDGEEGDTQLVGLSLFAVGAVATPIGWMMYSHNRTRLERVDEGAYRPIETRNQVRVGVVGVGPGALGVGVVAAF